MDLVLDQGLAAVAPLRAHNHDPKLGHLGGELILDRVPKSSIMF